MILLFSTLISSALQLNIRYFGLSGYMLPTSATCSYTSEFRGSNDSHVMHSIDYIIIDNVTIIENTSIVFNKSIVIEPTGVLVFRNSYISFSNMSVDPGLIPYGSLILENSTLYAPELRIYAFSSNSAYISANISILHSNIAISYLDLEYYDNMPTSYKVLIDSSYINIVGGGDILFRGIENLTVGSSSFSLDCFIGYVEYIHMAESVFCGTENCHVRINASRGEILSCLFNGNIRIRGAIRVVNSTLNGKKLLYAYDESNVVLSNGSYGAIIFVNSHNIEIKGVSVGYIELANTTNSIVERCSVNFMGIYIDSCRDVIIHKNTIASVKQFDEISYYEVFGILVDVSDSILIMDNKISSWGIGIYLPVYLCPCYNYDVVVRYNTLENCTFAIYWGAVKQCIVEDNTIRNCKVGIELFGDSSIGVNTIEYCDVGYQICGDDIVICGGTIRQNDIGILIQYGTNISILHAELKENRVGVEISSYASSWIPPQNMSIRINYNNIYSNLEHGIFINNTAGTHIYVDARYNWWGSPNGPEIKLIGDPEDPEEIWYLGNVSIIISPWSSNMLRVHQIIPIGFIIVGSLIVVSIIIYCKRRKQKEKNSTNAYTTKKDCQMRIEQER